MLNTQPQNCSGIRFEEIWTPKHNLSTPEHEILLLNCISVLGTDNYNILIVKLDILVMKTSIPEHFSNPRTEI